MLNKVNIIGRIGKDPEVRTTSTGKTVCNFSVGVARDRKVDGEEETDWFQIQAWDKTADYVSNYLGKGRLVAVAGRMQQRKYTNREGVETTVWELIADNVWGLDRAEDGSTPARGGNSRGPSQSSGYGNRQAARPPARPAPARTAAPPVEHEYDPFADD